MIKAVTFYSIFALCILISLGESQLFPTFDEYIVQFGKAYDDPD